MYVIGTAGHVDHGKSTLVQALTGIDPDRLTEEKRRGMTIDLGFAWVQLPSGREVSIVDVPGHERFIKNMLAGVGGIDLALLIVAADESVMPQTREHLAILDLLGVRRGIVVLTKADLADDDMLSLVQLEVEETLEKTTLAGAPVYSVSASTGQGIPALASAIDDALNETEPRRDVGRPRLPVDRAFTMAGFGTVVTGTLIDGSLVAGQSVEIVPGGLQARVRGLQSHRQKIETAAPGNRVAVNLSGISADEISRGDVVASQQWLRATRAVDVRLQLIPNAPHGVRHNLPVSFHAFAAETQAKVRLLDTDELEPGEQGWAQIWLEEPIALVRGDHFVIRSADATLGGGVVAGVDAKRHRRRHAPTLERLHRLAEGSPTAQLISALEGREPASIATLAKRANVSEGEALALAQEALAEGIGRRARRGGCGVGPAVHHDSVGAALCQGTRRALDVPWAASATRGYDSRGVAEQAGSSRERGGTRTGQAHRGWRGNERGGAAAPAGAHDRGYGGAAGRHGRVRGLVGA